MISSAKLNLPIAPAGTRHTVLPCAGSAGGSKLATAVANPRRSRELIIGHA